MRQPAPGGRGDGAGVALGGEPAPSAAAWADGQPASSLGGPEAAKHEADRRMVTVLFADVQGFTALSERLDPEQVTEIMNACWSVLAPLIKQYGGHIDKFIGDAVMALFGAPLAHEDDPVRALLAGLAMQRALAQFSEELQARHGLSLAMRIGVNTGEVIAGYVGVEGHTGYSYTVMGDPVNLASRLEHESLPGGILVGEMTYQLTRLAFDFKPRGPIPVRGKREPVPVYEVVGARGTGTLRWREHSGDVPLIGRAAELRELLARLATAVAGQGQVVYLVGEAGVGKSRLLGELRDRMGNGVGWYRIEQPPYGARIPYSGVVSLVRGLLGLDDRAAETEVRARIAAVSSRLGPGAGDAEAAVLADLLGVGWPERSVDALDPANRRRFLIRTVVTLLRQRAADQPLILAVEDLHFLDEASHDVFDAVLRAVPALPALLVGACRPDWVNRWADLPGAATVTLQTLSPGEAAEYIRALAGDVALLPETVEAIYGRTGGNALFIGEVIRSIREAQSAGEALDLAHLDIPASVHELIQARVDRLLPGAKRVLQVASVCGMTDMTFEEAVLARIDEVRFGLADCLASLRRHEYIDEAAPAPDRAFTFRHALTREVIYKNLLVARRRQLHRLVGAAMERVYRGQIDERVAILADHFRQSDEPLRAIGYLLPAADRAARLDGNHPAADYARQAIALMLDDPSGHREQLSAAYERLGLAAEQLGDAEECLVAYASALLLTRVGERENGAQRLADEEIRAAVERIKGLRAPGEPARERAERVLDELLSTTPVGTRRAREANLYSRIGEAFRHRKGAGDAFAWYDHGLALLGPEPSRERLRLEVERAVALFRLGRKDEALAQCEAAIALAEQFEPSSELARAYNTLGLVAASLEERDRAVAAHRAALTIAQRVGDPLQETASRLNLAIRARAALDLRQAIEENLASLAIAERFGFSRPATRIRNNLGNLYLDTDRVHEAIDHFTSVHAEMERLEEYRGVAVVGINLARALLRARQPHEALVHLQRALPLAEGSQVWEIVAFGRSHCALAHLYLGGIEEAEQQAQLGVERAREVRDAEFEGEALRVRGQVHEARGRLREAQADFEASESILREGAKSEPWLLIPLARTLRRLGALYQRLEADGLAHFDGVRWPEALIAEAEATFERCARHGAADPHTAAPLARAR